MLPQAYSKGAIKESSAGLKLKPTYEELIRYIQEDPEKIMYPNRDATILSNSFEFNATVGEGFRQMALLNNSVNQAAQHDAMLRNYASVSSMNFAQLKAMLNK